MAVNDEFFAPAANLVKATTPEWREDVFTDRGKWMDGWRASASLAGDMIGASSDSASPVRQAGRGRHHALPRQPPEARSLEACGVGLDDVLPGATWRSCCPAASSAATPSTASMWRGDEGHPSSVQYLPRREGGATRVLGVPLPALQEGTEEALPDLAGAVLGGASSKPATTSSDRPMHFSDRVPPRGCSTDGRPPPQGRGERLGKGAARAARHTTARRGGHIATSRATPGVGRRRGLCDGSADPDRRAARGRCQPPAPLRG